MHHRTGRRPLCKGQAHALIYTSVPLQAFLLLTSGYARPTASIHQLPRDGKAGQLLSQPSSPHTAALSSPTESKMSNLPKITPKKLWLPAPPNTMLNPSSPRLPPPPLPNRLANCSGYTHKSQSERRRGKVPTLARPTALALAEGRCTCSVSLEIPDMSPQIISGGKGGGRRVCSLPDLPLAAVLN